GRFEGYQAGAWQDILTGNAIGTFIDLTDTPATYASAGQLVRINATEDGLEFIDFEVGNLSDVDLTGLDGGYVLAYDSTSGNWEAASLGSLTTSIAIDDLTDAMTFYAS